MDAPGPLSISPKGGRGLWCSPYGDPCVTWRAGFSQVARPPPPPALTPTLSQQRPLRKPSSRRERAPTRGAPTGRDRFPEVTNEVSDSLSGRELNIRELCRQLSRSARRVQVAQPLRAQEGAAGLGDRSLPLWIARHRRWLSSSAMGPRSGGHPAWGGRTIQARAAAIGTAARCPARARITAICAAHPAERLSATGNGSSHPAPD